MNKEQQIEEMANIPYKCIKKSCAECVENNRKCVDYERAEALYNAGYRKVPKGSFICSADETNLDVEVCNNCGMKQADELFERDKEIERLKAENERFVNNMKNMLEIEKENAVKEFARKVKECSYCDNDFMDGKWHRYVFVDDIDELLKEYE